MHCNVKSNPKLCLQAALEVRAYGEAQDRFMTLRRWMWRTQITTKIKYDDAPFSSCQHDLKHAENHFLFLSDTIADVCVVVVLPGELCIWDSGASSGWGGLWEDGDSHSAGVFRTRGHKWSSGKHMLQWNDLGAWKLVLQIGWSSTQWCFSVENPWWVIWWCAWDFSVGWGSVRQEKNIVILILKSQMSGIGWSGLFFFCSG